MKNSVLKDLFLRTVKERERKKKSKQWTTFNTGLVKGEIEEMWSEYVVVVGQNIFVNGKSFGCVEDIYTSLFDAWYSS